MEIKFCLSMPRDAASVAVVRHFCRNALRDLGATTGCVTDIEIAVTEACTNVLKHSHTEADHYEVAVTIRDTDCEISVFDTGTGFEERTSTLPEETAEGGRGLFLMRALVDKLNFLSDRHGRTAVHLVKALVLRDDAPLRRLADSSV